MGFFSLSGSDAPVFTLDTPQSYQTVQRSGAGATNAIPVRGHIYSGPTTVEARWNGGSYTIIGAGQSGDFNLSLTGQSAGQGTLDVRVGGSTVISREYVGIGDVYVIAGQSNAVGQGDGLRAYSHATLKATMFSNRYKHENLLDPTDSATGQALYGDSVSLDSDGTMGSCWPLLATAFMTDQSVPIAFIPCACGTHTAIVNWLPGANHQDRTTLYGSMVYRALQQPLGVKAVLFELGETDSQLNTAQATFNSRLDTLADAVFADLGVALVPAKLQKLSVGYDPAGWYATINAAIADAWADNVHVKAGADLSGLGPFSDGRHFVTAAEQQSQADAWWTALDAVFYP